MVSGSSNGNPSSMTTKATMEGPMPYVDCFGEPPLLDDKEEIAQAKELWEEVIVDSKNSKDDDGCVAEFASITDEDLAAYNKQVFESDGFDVDSYPGFAFGMITPVYSAKENEEFLGYAKLAIKEYNKKKGENFKVVGIEKGNVQTAGTFNYYITFAAVDENAFDHEPKMFQALVAIGRPLDPYLPCFGIHVIVDLCRQKGDPSEGYYTDFGYSMFPKV